MPAPKNYRRCNVYFKPEEWERILKNAAFLELKPTTYVKQAAVYAQVKKYDTTDLQKLMLAINRYGNNLKQIATAVNTTDSVCKADIDILREDMAMIKKAVIMYLGEYKYEPL